MANLLHDIGQHIIDNNLGQALNTDIFLDYRPDDPDNLIVISEYSGSGIALGLDDFTNRSVQILVRNKSNKEAHDLLWKIFKLFNNAETREVRMQDRFTMMYPRQTPFKMSIDNKQRPMWVFNLGVSTKFD